MSVLRAVLIVALFVGLLLTTGPLQAAGGVGIVAQPGDALRVGDKAPDFPFYTASGKRAYFHASRGDATILAFVDSSRPDVCAIAGTILQLAEKYSGIETDVKFICVSAPDGDTCDLDANVVQKCGLQSLHILGLCDAGGRVRSMFRAKSAGVFYLIDGDGRITAIGKVEDLRGMERALRAAVRDYEANLPGPFNDD